MRRKKSKFSLFLLFFFLILAYYQMGIEVRAQDIYFRLPSKNKMKNDMEKVFDLNGLVADDKKVSSSIEVPAISLMVLKK